MDSPITNPSVTGGSIHPNASTSQNASLNSIMKLVSNKTHVGPAVKSANSNSLLSAAANKIRLNNDLKVSVSDPSREKTPVSTSGSKSIVIGNSNGQCNAQTAVAVFEAWDKFYGDKPGTPDYIEKANRLNAVRSQVYASFGISFDPTKKGSRPELTEEQRIAYSEAVKPYSFDYYEVRLSYKQTGHKAVRSKTYRFLNAPDLASIKSKLTKQAKVVLSNFSITQGKSD
jgi:hypothetical protein